MKKLPPRIRLEIDLKTMSQKAVASKYGCCSSTVRRWQKRHGIELDPDLIFASSHMRDLFNQGVVLTREQQSILYGSLLGDGRLARSRKNAKFTFCQGAPHQRYVTWMWKRLQPFTRRPVRESICCLKSTGKCYKAFDFYTACHPIFTQMHELFYPDGRKIVPRDVYLDELTLAVWFMDDGSRNRSSNCSLFHTQGFTVTECEFLLEILRDEFSLEGKVYTDNDGPCLGFRRENHYLLHEIVDPLLHEDFEYKKIPLMHS